MGISVVCSCGTRLKARAGAAGKRVKCPACGRSVRVEAPDEESEEEPEVEAPRRKKKRKPKSKGRKHAGESWLQAPLLGLRVGAWLIGLACVGGLALLAVLIVPKAVPALGNQPYYTLRAETDHVVVTIHNTDVGDIPVTLKKRPVRAFDGLGVGAGLPEYELPTTTAKGTRNAGGKSVRWEVECTKESGVTEVRCDDKPLRLSHW